jgi:hypothetical protein
MMMMTPSNNLAILTIDNFADGDYNDICGDGSSMKTESMSLSRQPLVIVVVVDRTIRTAKTSGY